MHSWVTRQGLYTVGLLTEGLLAEELGIQLRDESERGDSSNVAKLRSKDAGSKPGSSQSPETSSDSKEVGGKDAVERYLERVILA